MASDDREAGHREWVRQTLTIQEEASRQLAEATVSTRDPFACLREIADDPIAQQEMKAQARLHALIISYHDYVRPYRHKVEELWKSPLEPSFEVSGKEQTISLSDLSEWRFNYINRSVQEDGHRTGQRTVNKRYRLYLPVAVASACHSKLNECIHQLGFAAAEPELPDKDTPPEVPEHIRENAPAYGGGL